MSAPRADRLPMNPNASQVHRASQVHNDTLALPPMLALSAPRLASVRRTKDQSLTWEIPLACIYKEPNFTPKVLPITAWSGPLALYVALYKPRISTQRRHDLDWRYDWRLQIGRRQKARDDEILEISLTPVPSQSTSGPMWLIEERRASQDLATCPDILTRSIMFELDNPDDFLATLRNEVIGWQTRVHGANFMVTVLGWMFKKGLGFHELAELLRRRKQSPVDPYIRKIAMDIFRWTDRVECATADLRARPEHWKKFTLDKWPIEMRLRREGQIPTKDFSVKDLWNGQVEGEKWRSGLCWGLLLPMIRNLNPMPLPGLPLKPKHH